MAAADKIVARLKPENAPIVDAVLTLTGHIAEELLAMVRGSAGAVGVALMD